MEKKKITEKTSWGKLKIGLGKDCIGSDFDGVDSLSIPDFTPGIYNLVMGMSNKNRRNYE